VVDAQAFLKQALKKPVALGVASHLRAPLRSARFRRGAKVGNAGREALACAADYLF
jgi:hypothetical protein